MYRKLLPLLNHFVLLRQGMLNRSYVGRLVDIDQETLEIQTYHPDGTEAECWTICLNSITEILTQSQQLDMLALKVKWVNSQNASDSDESTHTNDHNMSISG